MGARAFSKDDSGVRHGARTMSNEQGAMSNGKIRQSFITHCSLLIANCICYCFVHVEPPLGLVYVPMPPLAARYFARKSPGKV